MARMTKAEREAEAEEITALIPLNPSTKVVDQFMEEEYDKSLSVFRSQNIKNENGKSEKVVSVTCGRCSAQSIFPYEKLNHSSMSCGCHSSAYYMELQDEYGFFDDREMITLFSGRMFHCPFCGAKTTVYNFSRLRYRPIAEHKRYAQEILTVRNHIIVIYWKLIKSINRDCKETFYFERENAAFQVDGRMFRATGFEWFGMSKYPAGRWLLLRGGYKEGIGGVKKSFTYWDEEALNKAEECNDGLITYLEYGTYSRFIFAERYLSLWAKMPAAENIAKKYPKYMSSIFENTDTETVYAKIKRLWNVRKVKPHEIIGLEKEECERVLKEAAGAECVGLYKICRNNKIKNAERVLSIPEGEANKITSFIKNETFIKSGAAIGKTINYIFSKVVIGKQTGIYMLLEDYWNMLIKTEGNVADEKMFPKDIKAAHDEAVERYEEKQNKALSDKIRSRYKGLTKYSFTDEELGLTIRPPKNHAEFILEGKYLHHCVATYAKSHSEAKTTILFIRKTDNPNDPYYTLEYKKGKVMQNSGMGNCDRTEEVAKFEAEWLEHIKKMEVKKNGKRNNKSNSGHAVA